MAALINVSTGLVENLIVATSSDPAPDGYVIIDDPPAFVKIGTVWDGAKFIDPGERFATSRPGMM